MEQESIPNALQLERLSFVSLIHLYKHDNLSDIVQLLLENDVDTNARDKDGSTLLHQLCKYYKGGNRPMTDIIQILINKGADVNAKTNRFGHTPLLNVCYNNYAERTT